ncbi:acetyl-CoA carboxylase biotin carboxyl carrier protein [Butyrivibrio sp. NC2007]|uniref:acetyl-CoA carboxylase biotin carboxyl carrier protein n=1 Tax=Butyrivibrio sp. NC2007 TaxID=1280683 RepID=UPI0003B33C5F|nr:acetyl-CoA carboxylase biotin carboxyl carrier protein subunit [Butyrivibrio sp. NC2007]
MTNSLKDYEDMFRRLSLSELEVEDGDFKMRMKREWVAPSVAVVPEGAMQIQASEMALEPALEAEAESFAVSGVEVKAPLLGVFHGAVGGKRAVKAGDKVEKGDVLCTLEAMKMMNEVKAPVSGTIKQVLAAEGDLVEFDQVLFVIE